MIWQNPWAWTGLAALAIPVLIHMLGRRSARTQRFPSLRFLDASQLLATRRTRLTDLPLLGVRVAILASAVAALAAPLILTGNRTRDLGRAIARAIIVDTSASMMVHSATGTAGAARERAVDAARREAALLAKDARTGVILETRVPAAAIRGAAAWLEMQHGKLELIIVSDFQQGTLDSTDVASVRANIGISLKRIATDALPNAIDVVTRRGDREIIARVVQAPDTGATVVEWTTRSPVAAASAPGDTGLLVLAGAGERGRSEAALHAASAIAGSISIPTERPVLVVHRGFESRAQLLRDAQPLTTPWQGELIARLRSDSTLIAAASSSDVGPLTTDSALNASTLTTVSRSSPFAVVARTRAGEPAILAAADRLNGRDRLMLFVRADAGSLASAALIVAISRASAAPTPVSELDPARIAAATLARWSRPAASATTTRTNTDGASSDGRWFWLLALALIGVETWMRRGQRPVTATDVVRERAA